MSKRPYALYTYLGYTVLYITTLLLLRAQVGSNVVCIVITFNFKQFHIDFSELNKMRDQLERSEEALQHALAVVARIKFRLYNLSEKHDGDKLQLRYK